MSRDYYEVLGVKRDAAADEIRKAYRNLARQFHPDRNPGDKQAEARFKEIQDAYDVLNDKTKRAQFDRFGFVGNQPGAGGAGGFNWGGGGGGFPGGVEIDPEIMSQILEGGLGEMFGQRKGRGGRGRRAARPEPVSAEVEVPFLAAALGSKVPLNIDGHEDRKSVV